jgi:hypothetical protein
MVAACHFLLEQETVQVQTPLLFLLYVDTAYNGEDE